MFLTVTSTAPHATDLGYLLHKHPGRVQGFELPFGVAHVFYPNATDDRCTAALLVEVDPIGLARSASFRGDPSALGQYVNDRPYAASSLLAVALVSVFRSALAGTCSASPELPSAVLPLDIHLPVVSSRGGPQLCARLFEPLGWTVAAQPLAWDETVPLWGSSTYVDLTLTGQLRLADALSHLYVLLPVLDGSKHYWVGSDEVDKLVRRGGAWLGSHPDRDLIMARYLAHQRHFMRDATARLEGLDERPALAGVDDDTDVAELAGAAASSAPAAATPATATPATATPATATPATATPATATPATATPATGSPPLSLAEARRAAVLAALREHRVTSVADIGCGEGALLRDVLADPAYERVVGVDVSPRALTIAERRLDLARMADRQRARLTLMQSSVTYRDPRLAGLDALVLVEVIEHVDLSRLAALERSVFHYARPRVVVVTTPNADYNVRYQGLGAGEYRHTDHRFEWGRVEFTSWCQRVGEMFGYAVDVRPVGDRDPDVGAPTQLAVFTRADRMRAEDPSGVTT